MVPLDASDAAWAGQEAHQGIKKRLFCGQEVHFPPAANMEPQRLMKEFGGRIVFWGGGCETQKILPLGTPEEIREHVRHNLGIFGGGNGGYVFTQVHNIQQNVPVENVEAMFAAAYEFG